MVSFPFRRDTYSEVETLFGYRIQHLTTMGPTKGGIGSLPTSTWARSPPSPCS